MRHGIVRAGRILTHAASRTQWTELHDAAIYHEDGRIVEVGGYTGIRQRHPDAPELGGDRFVAVPGFVNAHHHVGLTPFQLGAPDLPNEWWSVARMAGRGVDPYLDTLYSCFELLASGVTTVQHIRGLHFGSVAELLADSEAVLRAYAAVGMRVSYSTNARDQNRLVQEDDERFAASLPAHLQPLARWYLSKITLRVEDYFGVFFALRDRHANDPRVRIQLAPANLHWLSDTGLSRFAALARESGASMHMHLLETPYQREYARRRTPAGAIEYLERHGLLTERLTLGHAVWLTDAEIERVAVSGTRVCVNCSSNFRLGNGMAPVTRFLEAGIGIGLGIDEAGINDDRDMLQEMRMVLKTQRLPPREHDALGAGEVLRMATEGSAATTPFGDSIGRIAPGCAADLVLLDLNSIVQPFLDPSVSTVDAVVHRAKSTSVKTVLVAGEVVYENGAFARIDRAAVLDELARHMQRPQTEDEQRRRQLSSALMPHVRRFYDGYVQWDDMRPSMIPNSLI